MPLQVLDASHIPDPGFPVDLCTTFLGFQGGSCQDTLEIMCNLTPEICFPCPLCGLKMEYMFFL